MNINTMITSLIAPFMSLITAGVGAVTKAFQWFTINPLYTLIGFYVFMVALRGGSFKLGSKASTEVKK